MDIAVSGDTVIFLKVFTNGVYISYLQQRYIHLRQYLKYYLSPCKSTKEVQIIRQTLSTLKRRCYGYTKPVYQNDLYKKKELIQNIPGVFNSVLKGFVNTFQSKMLELLQDTIIALFSLLCEEVILSTALLLIPILFLFL